MRAYQNFINGQWVDSASGKSVPNINPANTDDIIGHAPQSTREEAQAAIAAAQEAFPAWRSTPAPARGRILAKAVQLCSDRKEEIARTMTREEGKTLNESRGEVQKSINLLEYYAGASFRVEGRTSPSEVPNTFVYTLRQPLGVVSAITPWNFPFCIPVWKTAPALVAGNTVVFKAASNTPGCAALLVKLYEDAGLPKGVLNLVYGSGGTVGDEFVNNAAIRAVSFTGSCETGGAVAKQAAAHLAKVTCEMGGKNPAVIMDDADLDLAVEGVAQGAFGSTGQRCTATSRVILHKAIADRFIEKLVERVKKIKVGDGMQDGVTMGPAVDKAQYETDLRYIEIAKKEGCLCLVGGEALPGKGYFVAPTVFDGVKPGMTLAQEEVFGPVLAVLHAGDFDEAMKIANGVQFGLTCSIYTSDANLVMRFTDRIEAGMVHINSPTVGGEAQLPFGGFKQTGYGSREMSDEGLNFFTQLKTVFYDYTGVKRQTNIYQEADMARIVRGGLIQAANPVTGTASVKKIKDAMIAKHEKLIAQAAKKGVQVLCMQEIFYGPYFCCEQEIKWYESTERVPDGPTTKLMQKLAKKYGMVLVVPVYEEEAIGTYYNTAAVIDANGKYLGKYRKNHIPHCNPGFWEKFYFKPGNLGYPVFDTAVGKVGVYICYDRHFPEGWRMLGLNGAEIVFNPSATVAGLSEYLWKLEQPAAAVANIYYVGAINRVGTEKPWDFGEFYGQSYFANPRGKIIAEGPREKDAVIVADLDMDLIRAVRNVWQFYRDRRPDSYDNMVKQLP